MHYPKSYPPLLVVGPKSPMHCAISPYRSHALLPCRRLIGSLRVPVYRWSVLVYSRQWCAYFGITEQATGSCDREATLRMIRHDGTNSAFAGELMSQTVAIVADRAGAVDD